MSELPEIKFTVTHSSGSIEISSLDAPFTVDITDVVQLRNAYEDLRQARMHLVAALNDKKKIHSKNKIDFQSWLADKRNAAKRKRFGSADKTFKNTDEMQDALYTDFNEDMIAWEKKIIVSRAARDELAELLELIKGLLYTYGQLINAYSGGSR